MRVHSTDSYEWKLARNSNHIKMGRERGVFKLSVTQPPLAIVCHEFNHLTVFPFTALGWSEMSVSTSSYFCKKLFCRQLIHRILQYPFGSCPSQSWMGSAQKGKKPFVLVCLFVFLFYLAKKSIAEHLGAFHSTKIPVWNFGNFKCPMKWYIPVAQTRPKPKRVWLLFL